MQSGITPTWVTNGYCRNNYFRLRKHSELGGRAISQGLNRLRERALANPVPKGRLKITQDEVLETFQPSLRDSSSLQGGTQHFVLGYSQPSLRDSIGEWWVLTQPVKPVALPALKRLIQVAALCRSAQALLPPHECGASTLPTRFSSPWVSRRLMGTRLKPCPDTKHESRGL